MPVFVELWPTANPSAVFRIIAALRAFAPGSTYRQSKPTKKAH